MFDGVLFRWGRSVRRVCRERFGIEVPEEEWFAERHVTATQWRWIWSDEGVREIFGTGESFPGSVKAARELGKVGRVRILTACPEAAWALRVDWLRRRGIRYDEIRFVDPPPLQRSVGTDGRQHAAKSSVRPHCDVYIDDSPANCLELALNTRAQRIILVDHSWNRGTDAPRSKSPRIVRATSWDEVLAITREVAEGVTLTP